jgi:quercetin 2,3-dioxygenase
MIAVRRAADRIHKGWHSRVTWLTFGRSDGWSDVESLTECRLAPRVGFPRVSLHDVEVLTYVCEGALAFEDSLGGSRVVQAGEFLLLTAGRGIHRRLTNASRTDSVRYFQIGVRPWEANLAPEHGQQRFTTAQRRGGLRIVASHDARDGSLLIHQDAQIYSALLDYGTHVVHELAPGRCQWLHVVQGEVALDDTVLAAGDGAGITARRVISFTAREDSEVLLIDVGSADFRGPTA